MGTSEHFDKIKSGSNGVLTAATLAHEFREKQTLPSSHRALQSELPGAKLARAWGEFLEAVAPYAELIKNFSDPLRRMSDDISLAFLNGYEGLFQRTTDKEALEKVVLRESPEEVALHKSRLAEARRWKQLEPISWEDNDRLKQALSASTFLLLRETHVLEQIVHTISSLQGDFLSYHPGIFKQIVELQTVLFANYPGKIQGKKEGEYFRMSVDVPEKIQSAPLTKHLRAIEKLGSFKEGWVRKVTEDSLVQPLAESIEESLAEITQGLHGLRPYFDSAKKLLVRIDGLIKAEAAYSRSFLDREPQGTQNKKDDERELKYLLFLREINEFLKERGDLPLSPRGYEYSSSGRRVRGV